jgi:hypothetical protein
VYDFFCAVADNQKGMHAIVPSGFPELSGLVPRAGAFIYDAAQAQLDHDVCKVRTAVHLLKTCNPDSDFEPILILLAQCKVPALQNAHGCGRRLGTELMEFVVQREVKATALMLCHTPM